MNLYLIRHASAVDAGLPGYNDDSLRPLTDKGRKEMRMVAKSLRAFGTEFDLILSSPFIRAQETAKILAGVYKPEIKTAYSDNLVPSGDATRLLAEINDKYLVDSLAIVGHEPALSILISLLIGNNARVNLTLKKAGVCRLSANDLHPASPAMLEWLLPPSILKFLSNG